MTQTHPSDSPATLVAIARAARLCGDRELERHAKQQLRERFGITIKFERERQREEATA